MRILKWLVLGLLALAVAFCAIGYFVLADTAHVERSTLINAKPATVFTVLNGFRNFDRWSPWAGLDPNAKTTLEGPVQGVGAKHSWSSEDPSVGSGGQEIVESKPFEQIKVKLHFEGFDGDSVSTYTLTPEGEGTRVVWSYDAGFRGNVMNRYFGLMMEGMLGPDYEKGLAQLKTYVESLPQADFSGLAVELVMTEAFPIAYASGVTSASEAATVLAERYARIQEFMTENGLAQAGAPLAITQEFDEETKSWKFDAAIPIDRSDVVGAPESDVKTGRTYAGLALKATHRGAYAAMEPTYAQLVAYKTVAGFEDNGKSWEHYVSDPGNTPEAELVTHIYWPVQ